MESSSDLVLTSCRAAEQHVTSVRFGCWRQSVVARTMRSAGVAVSCRWYGLWTPGTRRRVRRSPRRQRTPRTRRPPAASASLPLRARTTKSWQQQIDDDDDDVTFIAQIRTRRKCAAVCRRRAEMFSIWSIWKWSTYPQIAYQTIPDDEITEGEAALSITCLRPWNDEPVSAGRSHDVMT